jgi:ParB family chromosome partitioning protein
MEEIIELPLNQIHVVDLNPRKYFDESHISELSESIKKDGQWDPILVKPNSHGYDLISGECRFRAIKKLGQEVIKARILNVTTNEAHLLALKTNIMRRDLNPVEEANAVKNLVERGWSINDISKQLDKSKTWISFRLKIANKASEGVKNAVLSNKISFSAALEISDLDEGLQGSVTSKIIQERLNYSEILKLIKLIKTAESKTDLDLFLETPLKEFIILSYKSMELKKQRNMEKKDVDILYCGCGEKIIVNWSKRLIISEKAYHNEC